MLIHIFAVREPAKPLNDAQMCGSFFFIDVWLQKIHLRKCTHHQAIWCSYFNHEGW